MFGYDTGVIAGALLFIKTDFDFGSFAQGLVVASNQTPCASGNHYPAGTEFAGSSGPMTLTTTWGWKAAQQIKCNQSWARCIPA